MGIVILSIFFLSAGLLFLVWPEELRDWVLKSYVHAGFAIPVFMRKLMFTPGYILAFRIGGVLAIAIGAMLFWLYLRHSL